MTMWATEVDLDSVNPDARVYMLPCIAGHVGSDTAGVILSEEPHLRDEMTLIVDVGTNAEIVLGNRAGLLAASSPTGPAFEGAQITCGQRAAPGAIERLRIPLSHASRSSAVIFGLMSRASTRKSAKPVLPVSVVPASSKRWARCC
jgi:uncharacterized 2Fe-2S/4Fe-4S cluster protein (DUF4445 family)